MISKPASAIAEVEVWVCPNCAEVFTEEPELTTLYECGNCGTTFSKEDEGSNRCPDCNKFAAKQDDGGCPECAEAWEGFDAETRYQHEGCDEYHGSTEEAQACAAGEDYIAPAKPVAEPPFKVGDKVMALGGKFLLHYTGLPGLDLPVGTPQSECFCLGPATVMIVARSGELSVYCAVHDWGGLVKPFEVRKL